MKREENWEEVTGATRPQVQERDKPNTNNYKLLKILLVKYLIVGSYFGLVERCLLLLLQGQLLFVVRRRRKTPLSDPISNLPEVCTGGALIHW